MLFMRMNPMIKLGLASIAVLAGIILSLSLLLPAHTRVSRAVTITVPPDSLMAYVQDLSTWMAWNEILSSRDQRQIMADAKQIRTPQILLRRVNLRADSLVINWQFKGQPVIPGALYITRAGSSSSVLQWYFDFTVRWYPWEKFGSIIYDQQVGPAMERSLNNLKRQCEQKFSDL